MPIPEYESNNCSSCKNGCRFGKGRVYCNKDGHFHPAIDGISCDYYEPKGGLYENSRTSFQAN